LAYQRLGNFDDARHRYDVVIKRAGELAESSAFNLAAEYAARSNDCDSSDAKQPITLLRKSLALAEKDGQIDVRRRRIIGKLAVENGQNLQKLRSCGSFRKMIAES
jgi:hypothetical protein